ncbi:MAG: hypothetical protein H5T83_06315 [Actinotalea sp.]|nr:hypothetical protein [Actinotalea sp.]
MLSAAVVGAVLALTGGAATAQAATSVPDAGAQAATARAEVCPQGPSEDSGA